jgi:hypothetical protein
MGSFRRKDTIIKPTRPEWATAPQLSNTRDCFLCWKTVVGTYPFNDGSVPITKGRTNTSHPVKKIDSRIVFL